MLGATIEIQENHAMFLVFSSQEAKWAQLHHAWYYFVDIGCLNLCCIKLLIYTVSHNYRTP